MPASIRRRSASASAAPALPGVEADVVVVAAGRDEGGLGAIALHQREAEHAAIEIEGALDVGDLEVDVADPGAGRDGAGGLGEGLYAIAHGCPSRVLSGRPAGRPSCRRPRPRNKARGSGLSRQALAEPL